MAVLYPFTFQPIFKERVWGGRQLEALYHKPLPPDRSIGESWEISDRPGDVSVIANGPLAGKDLHWLVEPNRPQLLSDTRLQAGRFPLLIKILDAREKLSLQVHPPASQAAELGGEPKTEMWYIAQAAPGAELYVGLKRGVTRKEFEERMQNGTVADCFHRLSVRAGDAMFLPSGRVHAIGEGLVIFEIQQNSDSTYRVFDWNRAGLDGKLRPLHHRESLASIDFQDFEPGLIQSEFVSQNGLRKRALTTNPLFRVEEWELRKGSTQTAWAGLTIIGLVQGKLTIADETGSVSLCAGGFCLLPSSANKAVLSAEEESTFLMIEPA